MTSLSLHSVVLRYFKCSGNNTVPSSWCLSGLPLTNVGSTLSRLPLCFLTIVGVTRCLSLQCRGGTIAKMNSINTRTLSPSGTLSMSSCRKLSLPKGPGGEMVRETEAKTIAPKQPCCEPSRSVIGSFVRSSERTFHTAFPAGWLGSRSLYHPKNSRQNASPTCFARCPCEVVLEYSPFFD